MFIYMNMPYGRALTTTRLERSDFVQ
jgi:hypothetical protein